MRAATPSIPSIPLKARLKRKSVTACERLETISAKPLVTAFLMARHSKTPRRNCSGAFLRPKKATPVRPVTNHEMTVAQAAPAIPISSGPMKKMSSTTFVTPEAIEE